MNPVDAIVLELLRCANSRHWEKPRGSRQQIPRLTSPVMEKEEGHSMTGCG